MLLPLLKVKQLQEWTFNWNRPIKSDFLLKTSKKNSTGGAWRFPDFKYFFVYFVVYLFRDNFETLIELSLIYFVVLFSNIFSFSPSAQRQNRNSDDSTRWRTKAIRRPAVRHRRAYCDISRRCKRKFLVALFELWSKISRFLIFQDALKQRIKQLESELKRSNTQAGGDFGERLHIFTSNRFVF